MFQTFRNAWKIPELRNRLLFTLAILVVYRLGCAIPVPFVSGSALTQMFANGDMLSYLNMMSGGALARCTLFALGVTPYINASIIVQLLTVAIPALENLAKEADGQQKLQQINRYAGAVAVSYTHLDVYKRQLVPRAITRAPSPCRPCVLTLTTALQRLLPPTAASASRCGSTRAKSCRALRPLRRRKEATSNAVSYTHLDVYKRQLHSCPAGRCPNNSSLHPPLAAVVVVA